CRSSRICFKATCSGEAEQHARVHVERDEAQACGRPEIAIRRAPPKVCLPFTRDGCERHAASASYRSSFRGVDTFHATTYAFSPIVSEIYVFNRCPHAVHHYKAPQCLLRSQPDCLTTEMVVQGFDLLCL